jgi:hypothetical protein
VTAFGSAVIFSSTLPARAQEFAPGQRPGDFPAYAIVQGPTLGPMSVDTLRGRPADRVPLESLLQSCQDDGPTGNGDGARIDPIRCALPRSDDKPAATPGPNVGTQSTPGTTSVPSTAGPSQATSGTPPSGAGATPPAVVLGFAYYPPGELDPHEDPTRGRKGDRKVYLPNIVFPLRLAPDQQPHMNSQIWGHGGGGWDGKGEAGGSECDPVNYDAFQQRDTYCEVRGWEMPMCPGGTGHQGQDIRPPSCKNNTWDVVAVVDGIITQVTPNTTVQLKGGDGTDYFYLHMHPQSIVVKVGQAVKQGDVLGRVSKYLDADPNGTTMHLHFQARQTIRVDGKILSVYVPGYTSLIAAYRKAKGLDPGIGSDGNLIVDAQFEIGAPKPSPPSSPPLVPAAGSDQSAPGPAPSPAAGPSAPPMVPATTPDQPALSPPPTTPATAPDQPAPSPTSAPAPSAPLAVPATALEQPAPSPGPAPAPSPPPAVPATASDPSAPSPAPSLSPAPGSSPQPAPPAVAAAQPLPSPAPTLAPPSQSAPPAPSDRPSPGVQPWWQKAWGSTKEWWNKLGK